MVLSLSAQVTSDRLGSDLERLRALGVVGLDGAVVVSYALSFVLLGNGLLLVEVESNGKVLPLALEHGSLPEQLHLLIKQLPGFGGVALTDDGTSLELELVSREICLLMPDVLLLSEMRKRQHLGINLPGTRG